MICMVIHRSVAADQKEQEPHPPQFCPSQDGLCCRRAADETAPQSSESRLPWANGDRFARRISPAITSPCSRAIFAIGRGGEPSSPTHTPTTLRRPFRTTMQGHTAEEADRGARMEEVSPGWVSRKTGRRLTDVGMVGTARMDDRKAAGIVRGHSKKA